MHDEESPDDIVLSDEQLKEVIERATREISRPTGISIAELRQIAAELNIEPVALERALDEVIALPIAGQPVRSWVRRQLTRLGHLVDPFLPNKGRLVGGALFGGIAGWLNAFLMTFGIQSHYAIALAMVGITLANLLSRRLDRKLLPFLAETFATWLVYAAFWAGMYGDVTTNLLLWVGLWTSVATVLGWVLMRGTSGGGAQPTLLASIRPEKPTSSDGHRETQDSFSRPGVTWALAMRTSRA